jgi:MFS family permease
VARIGVGVGEAALSPAAYSMIADYFPPHKLGRALGTYSMGVYLGAGLAYVIGGLVIELVAAVPDVSLPVIGSMRSWQLTFFVVGLPGLLVALLVLTIREPVRRGLMLREGAPAPHVSVAEMFRFLWQQRRIFVAHFLGFSLIALLFNALTAWTPAFFIRKFGYTAPEIGISLGLIVFVFGSAGIVCGGWFSDYLSERGYRDAPLRAAAIGAVLLAPFAATATLMPDPVWSLVLLCPLLFFSSFPFGPAAAAMQLVTPNQMRGQVSALYLFAVNLFGIAWGPTIAALFTDYVFKDDRAVGYSIAIVSGLAAPLAAVILFSALRPFREAMDA